MCGFEAILASSPRRSRIGDCIHFANRSRNSCTVPGLVCCPDPYEAAEGADAIAILTDWQEFAALDWGAFGGWCGTLSCSTDGVCPSRRRRRQQGLPTSGRARPWGRVREAPRRTDIAPGRSSPVRRVPKETMASPAIELVIEGGAHARPGDRLRELWAYREVVWAFAERNTRLKYKQAALGVAWAVLQPLIFLGVFFLIFGRMAKVSGGGASYPAFALAALVPWFFIQNAVSFGAQALLTDGALVRKVYFPREAPVLGAVLSAGLDFAFGFALLLTLEPFLGGRLSWSLLAVVPLWLALAALASGVAMILAP